MKTNCITLNIGLNKNNGGTLSVPEVCHALRGAGLLLINSRLDCGEWEGIKEETLVAVCLSPLPPWCNECRLALAATIERLAATLCQSCIACQWPDGTGSLLPAVAPFDPAFFKTFENSSPELAAVDAVRDACLVQAEIAANACAPGAAIELGKAAHVIRQSRENLAAVVDLGPAFL